MTLPGAGLISKFKKFLQSQRRRIAEIVLFGLADGPTVSYCVKKKIEMMKKTMWRNGVALG